MADGQASDGFIVSASATGEEIGLIVNGLEEALVGVPRGHSIIALLSLTILMSRPDISTEQLHDSVEDVSRYICLLVSADEKQNMPKSQLN